MDNVTDQFVFKNVDKVKKVTYKDVTRTVTLNGYLADNGWEELDTLVILMYDCLILKDFSTFKAGDIVYRVVVDYEKGVIDILKNKPNLDDQKPWEKSWKGKLNISIS